VPRAEAARLLAIALLLAALGASCGGASQPAQGVRLQRVAVLRQPLALAVREGDPALYVAEKAGRVVAVAEGSPEPRVVLDLRTEVSLGAEQGLLGLAFAPGGRFLYVDFTDTHGDTHVTEFRMRGHVADPASRRDLLVVRQPFSNHNGGGLAFGPDGDLYVGLGDGGSAGDPLGNAQSRSTLLGKLLRIDPRPRRGDPYAVPDDNPLVGIDGARPEIWALGLRNPWRFSFDRATGDLWIGDVGQDAWEEIDRYPSSERGGANFGWNLFEGSARFRDGASADTVPPVFVYPNGDGTCAVTGGYVYRGTDLSHLAGWYVFGDFCLGRLDAIRVTESGAVEHRVLGPTVENLASFGQDADGELYALSLSGPVYRLEPDAAA
jgi:glucose/arabinose dehydrogenase